MKYIITFLALYALPLQSFTQQTINGTLMHDGQQRAYILYVPASYSAGIAVPLVFNFHGYTSNATEQLFYGDFRTIADTANFIVVHPEGTLFQGNTHWNVGGWTLGSTTDDVGFTEALLEELASNYSINLDRVYATGMSNGGFMSFLLACQLSDKFAAIASVAGTMTPQTFNNCNPTHPMPVLQIHGTNDIVIPYTGNVDSKTIDEVMQYWIAFNHCNVTAAITDLPNTNTTDGSTVVHYVYSGCDQNLTTEHLKINGGSHTWPGAAFHFPGTNYDIKASEEIWKFFARYDLNGLLTSTAAEDFRENNFSLHVYPNPGHSSITIELDIARQMDFEIISLLGEKLISGSLSSDRHEIDISDLPPNIYFLKVGDEAVKIMKTN